VLTLPGTGHVFGQNSVTCPPGVQAGRGTTTTTADASSLAEFSQDGSLPIAHRSLARRRPLPVGACGEACPGSAGESRVACLPPAGRCRSPRVRPGHPRVRWGRRSRRPPRVTVSPRCSSCLHWHPRRDRSTCVLAQRAGTILLSGPLLAMASFGTPRGHSLTVGARGVLPWPRSRTDAHPRTLLVS
jgi:hypothetical protein